MEQDDVRKDEPAEDGPKAASEDAPQVFALSRGEQGWQLSRRDFARAAVAAAGIAAGAAVRDAGAQQDPRQLCGKVRAHSDSVNGLAVTADQAYLVSAAADKKLKMWKLPEGGLFKSFDAHDAVNALASAPNNRAFAACADGWIRPFTLPEQRDRGLVQHGTWGRAVAVSPDGALLATGGGDKQVQVYALPGLESVRTISVERTVVSLAFLDGSARLAVGDDGGNLSVWPSRDGDREAGNLQHPNAVTSIAVSAASGLLATACNDGSVRIWSIRDKSLVKTLAAHQGMARGVAFADDFGLLITAGQDKKVRLWAKDGWASKATLTGHQGCIESLAVSAKHKLLATGDETGRVMLWKLPAGELIYCLTDLEAISDKLEGAKYKVMGSEGRWIEYTLPCGAPLPQGAICICNCVPGSICTCNKICTCDTVCGCVGNTVCTCDSIHYWYPN